MWNNRAYSGSEYIEYHKIIKALLCRINLQDQYHFVVHNEGYISGEKESIRFEVHLDKTTNQQKWAWIKTSQKIQKECNLPQEICEAFIDKCVIEKLSNEL